MVTARGTLSELAQVWRGAGHIAGSAATIVLVRSITGDPRLESLMNFDLGQAAMGVSIGDQPLARQLLGIPATHWPAWMLALGYPPVCTKAYGKLRLPVCGPSELKA